MILTLAMFALAAWPSYAQDEKLREVKGVIRTLDLKSGAVTLQQMYSDQQPSFSLAARDVPVSDALGKPAKLSDLREGTRVAVKVRNDADIVAIRVDGPYVHGMIRHVDLKTRSITFKDFIAEKTVLLPTEAKIVSQGTEVSLADCKVGEAIQLLYSFDKKTIVQAQIGKATHLRDPFLRVTRFYGILAEVDHAKRQATIFVQSADAGAIKTYEVTPDAFLRVLYHQKAMGEIPFDQFSKWVKVYYFVDRDTGRIINLDAELPLMVRRSVAKVDADAITIEDEKKDKVIPLAANIQVQTPRGEGKLAHIKPGQLVTLGLTLDRARVRVIYVWDK